MSYPDTFPTPCPRIRQLAIAALIVFGHTLTHAQAIMITDSITSRSLGETRKYGIILPQPFDPRTAYPVLYLLHGHDGGYRDWLDRTDVEQYVEGLPLIVVFPDADNSWYVDSYADTTKKYERYLMKDLFDTIERKYDIDPERRAIAGLSMGGYGALLYALKYPRRFAFAASFSGAFIFPRFIEDTIRQPVSRGIAASLKRAFGPESNPAREANDVYTLFRSAAPDSMPYVYMAAGIQDGFRYFLPGHRMFADSLRAAGVRYEYHETPGKHSWTYWNHELRLMLDRMKEVLHLRTIRSGK